MSNQASHSASSSYFIDTAPNGFVNCISKAKNSVNRMVSHKSLLVPKHQPAPCVRRQQAFSLLEVMIVLLVVGVLALVAIPSYSTYIVKANRAQAKSMLTEILQEQERHRIRRYKYTLDLSELGLSSSANRKGVLTPDELYVIRAARCKKIADLSVCVRLMAVPVTGSVQARAGELPLAINSLGGVEGEWH